MDLYSNCKLRAFHFNINKYIKKITFLKNAILKGAALINLRKKNSGKKEKFLSNK